MDKNLICLKDFEIHANNVLPKLAHDYYQSGANDEITLKENCSAFQDYHILPRFLSQSIANRDLKTKLLNSNISMPIGVAPTAMQRMAHPDGEVATARACEKAKTIMILSTLATASIEEVAEAAPDCEKWFQLYMYKDRRFTEDFVQRAKKSGYKAIVLTIDAQIFGTRLADIRNKFHLPSNLRMANFKFGQAESDAISDEKLSTSSASSLTSYVASLFDQSLTWEDVKWLRTITDLPLVIKGVLTVHDALMAIKCGASAIIVSNHGGRQLDTVPATISVLKEIADAVNGDCEIYLDGGVRNGTDVLKALALGAKAVFIGRPILWGLCYNGEDGVEKVLDIIRNEFDIAMALSGCASLDDIREYIVRRK